MVMWSGEKINPHRLRYPRDLLVIAHITIARPIAGEARVLPLAARRCGTKQRGILEQNPMAAAALNRTGKFSRISVDRSETSDVYRCYMVKATSAPASSLKIR